MHLSKQKADLFFSVYYPLLYYSFSEFAELGFEDFFDSGINNHIIARDNIYKNRHIIDSYITDHEKQFKAPFENAQIDLLRAIQKARIADFIAAKKNDIVYYIDLMNNNNIYQITGLTQEPWELIAYFPCCTRTALIQFGEDIVFDGLNHIKKLKYPQNAAKLIMRDLEDDLANKLQKNL